MTGLRLFATSGLVLVVSAGCQILGGFEDFSETCPAGASACRDGGTGGAGGQVSADSGAGGSRASGGTGGGVNTGGGVSSSGGRSVADGSTEPGRCPRQADPGAHGPTMTQVMRPNGTCFFIDTTEVTVGDYSEFLRAPHPLPQDLVCAWNVGDGGALGSEAFEPSRECVAAVSGGLDVTSGGERPMTCVDWCDALAFCVWAGKDLCEDDGNSLDAPERSDWYDACANGAARDLYGCGFGCQAMACNGATSGLGRVAPVGTVPGCVVVANDGKTAIHDLSGNVSEWTGWCNPETADGQCLTRGGGYASADSALECGITVLLGRKTAAPTLGFRCCAASKP